MTKDFCSRLTAEQAEKVHYAYSVIASTYENVCGGPYKAREYKEYFAAMDSRENLRQRFIQLMRAQDGDNEQQPTERGFN